MTTATSPAPVLLSSRYTRRHKYGVPLLTGTGLVLTIGMEVMEGRLPWNLDVLVLAIALVVAFTTFARLMHLSADGRALYASSGSREVRIPRETIVSIRPLWPWYYAGVQAITIEHVDESNLRITTLFMPKLKREGGQGTKDTVVALNCWLSWSSDDDADKSCEALRHGLRL